jgi:hypothetical protein
VSPVSVHACPAVALGKFNDGVVTYDADGEVELDLEKVNYESLMMVSSRRIHAHVFVWCDRGSGTSHCSVTVLQEHKALQGMPDVFRDCRHGHKLLIR